MTYKLTQNPNQIIRLSDSAIIPSGQNGDWQLYEKWKKEGGIPDTADSIVEVNTSIDARRLRLALIQLNLLDKVENAIKTLSKSAQVEWEYATIIEKSNPLVVSLSTNLNIDADKVITLALTLK